MRINGFRCDVCCKEHLLDPNMIFASSNDAMPDDWFVVSKGKWQQGKEPTLCCSVQCLHDWVEKKLPLPPAEVARIANAVQEETTRWEDWR